jgi:hypothetical protein
MSEEMIISSTATGQKENPELRRRSQARQLKEKENLTLAEKLLLAQVDEKFTYTFNGFDLEVYVPNREEHDQLTRLFSAYTKRGTEEEPLEKEYYDNALLDLAEYMAEFFMDPSITPELIAGGSLDISFLIKFLNEINEYQLRKSGDVTAVNGFRKNKRS